MNSIETISEEDLFERICDPTEPADRVARLSSTLDGLIEGRTRVVSLVSEELSVATVFANLLRSLDVALRYELVSWFTERAKRTFSDIEPTSGFNAVVVEHLLASASLLLPGQSIYRGVIEFGRKVLRPDSQMPISVQLEGARLLYDADALGDSPGFWMELCTRFLRTDESIAYVALSALMRKWPKDSLEYLLQTCASVDHHESADLASLITISADEITNGVSVEQFSFLFHAYSARFRPEIREALENVAAERGWSLSLGPIAALEIGPAIVYDHESAAALYLSRAMGAASEAEAMLNGEMFAAVCHYQRDQNRRLQHTHSPESVFPVGELIWLRAMRQAPARKFERARIDGSMELHFVRKAVEQEINSPNGRDARPDAEVLLRAVDERVSVQSYAEDAGNELMKLGFDKNSFLLGASEFHQDRLVMNVVAAALRGAGLPGAQVGDRAWEDRSFFLTDRSRKADVVIRGEIVASATPSGVFAFKGFRVFIRLDALRSFLDMKTAWSPADDAKRLIAAVGRHGDPKAALDLPARARLVLELGEVDAKGSAFEELRGALQRVAGIPDDKKPEPIEVSNDEAFEKFITGRARVYCGGAINNLLIDTWWKESEPKNFVELLSHDEIARGFVCRRGRAGDHNAPYVEDALHFRFAKKKNQAGPSTTKAEVAVTKLFRAAGRGLQKWSNEVMSSPEHLNGSTESCEAARRILRPLQQKRNGKYAFVTRLTDPALLVKTSDQFY